MISPSCTCEGGSPSTSHPTIDSPALLVLNMSPLPMYQPGVPNQNRVPISNDDPVEVFVDDISSDDVLAFQQALWDDMREHGGMK